MKIAILTSGILPVPAVQGGAVENLIDFYLDYNDRHKLHDITVFSTYSEKASEHKALQSDVNHYVYVNTNNILARIRKKIASFLNTKKGYYDHHIEFFIKEAIKRMRNEKFDMIIMENRPAYSLHFDNEQRIVYHLHNDHLNLKTRRCSDIYEAADRIICVSDFITSRVKTINHNDHKACTVYNGIDINKFSSCHATVNREALGLDENDFVIVFTGRIIPDKGIKQLIEAIISLKHYESIKLLVIGTSFLGNTSGNSQFMLSLNDLAKEIKDKIIFTGYVDYDEVPSYLHLADIAVLPSVWEEPFGLTCIEALAAGLPLITTSVGGIPEIMNDEVAILLNAGNNLQQELADSILALYNDKDKRAQMGKAALHHAKRFDKDEYARNFFESLEL